jgi:hypothetical protein
MSIPLVNHQLQQRSERLKALQKQQEEMRHDVQQQIEQQQALLRSYDLPFGAQPVRVNTNSFAIFVGLDTPAMETLSVSRAIAVACCDLAGDTASWRRIARDTVVSISIDDSVIGHYISDAVIDHPTGNRCVPDVQLHRDNVRCLLRLSGFANADGVRTVKQNAHLGFARLYADTYARMQKAIEDDLSPVREAREVLLAVNGTSPLYAAQLNEHTFTLWQGDVERTANSVRQFLSAHAGRLANLCRMVVQQSTPQTQVHMAHFMEAARWLYQTRGEAQFDYSCLQPHEWGTLAKQAVVLIGLLNNQAQWRFGQDEVVQYINEVTRTFEQTPNSNPVQYMHHLQQQSGVALAADVPAARRQLPF